jgi:hypothetical protein
VYEVVADADGNRYIAAHSHGSDVQLGVDLSGLGKSLSILSWRWRARELPLGGDERELKTMDSAASVYAVFGTRIFPHILKYVWSSSLPIGTTFKHPSSGRLTIITVNTGHPGQWQEVKRDLAADYKEHLVQIHRTLLRSASRQIRTLREVLRKPTTTTFDFRNADERRNS